MPTLLLSPRYTPDSIALAKAASGLGWSVQRLQTWHVPEGLPADGIALYGEPFFAAAIAEQLSLHLLEPPFGWLAALPVGSSKRRVSCVTLAEARFLMAPAFIKPADDKCFPARVYSSGAELRDAEHLPPQTTVLVSEPVEWEVEYRGFIKDGKLQTLSPYFRYGELAQTEDGDWPAAEGEAQEARDFYAGLLGNSGVRLPPGIVVDVGRIRGRGWAVVEANPAWSSGIYGCDPAQVLDVIAGACVKQDAVSDAHREWVISRAE